MSLADFDRAAVEPGSAFELGRGIIVVVDVPGRQHLAIVNALRRILHAYDAANPGQIHTLAGGAECKIVVAELESERHPDLAIYKTPPPAERDFWATWVPELVIEVVSPGSEDRDYHEKREEYLRFGVREYWVVDGSRGEVLVLRRSRGKWDEQVIAGEQRYETPILPGLQFEPRQVFATANP